MPTASLPKTPNPKPTESKQRAKDAQGAGDALGPNREGKAPLSSLPASATNASAAHNISPPASTPNSGPTTGVLNSAPAVPPAASPTQRVLMPIKPPPKKPRSRKSRSRSSSSFYTSNTTNLSRSATPKSPKPYNTTSAFRVKIAIPPDVGRGSTAWAASADDGERRRLYAERAVGLRGDGGVKSAIDEIGKEDGEAEREDREWVKKEMEQGREPSWRITSLPPVSASSVQVQAQGRSVSAGPGLPEAYRGLSVNPYANVNPYLNPRHPLHQGSNHLRNATSMHRHYLTPKTASYATLGSLGNARYKAVLPASPSLASPASGADEGSLPPWIRHVKAARSASTGPPVVPVLPPPMPASEASVSASAKGSAGSSVKGADGKEELTTYRTIQSSQNANVNAEAGPSRLGGGLSFGSTTPNLTQSNPRYYRQESQPGGTYYRQHTGYGGPGPRPMSFLVPGLASAGAAEGMGYMWAEAGAAAPNTAGPSGSGSSSSVGGASGSGSVKGSGSSKPEGGSGRGAPNQEAFNDALLAIPPKYPKTRKPRPAVWGWKSVPSTVVAKVGVVGNGTTKGGNGSGKRGQDDEDGEWRRRGNAKGKGREKEMQKEKPTTTTLRPRLRPRVWTGTKDELTAALPFLAAPRLVGGVSWAWTRGAYVLLDDSTLATRVSEMVPVGEAGGDESDEDVEDEGRGGESRTFDLYMTRALVQTTAKDKGVNATAPFEDLPEGELFSQYNYVPSTLPDGREPSPAPAPTSASASMPPPPLPARKGGGSVSSGVGSGKLQVKGKGKGKERAVDGMFSTPGPIMAMGRTAQLRPAFFGHTARMAVDDTRPVLRASFDSGPPRARAPTRDKDDDDDEEEGGAGILLEYPESEQGAGASASAGEGEAGPRLQPALPPPSPPQLFSSIPEQHSWISRGPAAASIPFSSSSASRGPTSVPPVASSTPQSNASSSTPRSQLLSMLTAVKRVADQLPNPKERLRNVLGELGDSVVAVEGRFGKGAMGAAKGKRKGEGKGKGREVPVDGEAGSGGTGASPPTPVSPPKSNKDVQMQPPSSPLSSPISPLSSLPPSPARPDPAKVTAIKEPFTKPTDISAAPGKGMPSTFIASGRYTPTTPTTPEKTTPTTSTAREEGRKRRSDECKCGRTWAWDYCAIHGVDARKRKAAALEAEAESVAVTEDGRRRTQRKAAVEGREKIKEAEDSLRERAPRKRRKTDVEVKREDVDAALAVADETVSVGVEVDHGKGKKERPSVKVKVVKATTKEKGNAEEVQTVEDPVQGPLEQPETAPSPRIHSRNSEAIPASAPPPENIPATSVSTSTERMDVSEEGIDTLSTRTRGTKRKSVGLAEVLDKRAPPSRDTSMDSPRKRQKNGGGEEREVNDDRESEIDHDEDVEDEEKIDQDANTRASSPDIPLSSVLRSEPKSASSASGSVIGPAIWDAALLSPAEDEAISSASSLPPPPWLSGPPTSLSTSSIPATPPASQPPSPTPMESQIALALPSLPTEIRALIDAFVSGSPVVVVASKARVAELLPQVVLNDNSKTKSGSKALSLAHGMGKGKAKSDEDQEWDYAWLGLFRILALSEEAVPSTLKGAQMTVRWRFRVQWVRGGEYIFQDSGRSLDFGRPWWTPPTSTMPRASASSSKRRTKVNVGGEVKTPELYMAHRRAHPSYIRLLPTSVSPSSTNRIPIVEDDTKDNPSLELLPTTFTSTPFNVFLSPDAFPPGWFCAACGKVNAQSAMRHRRCASSHCIKEGGTIEVFATDLADIRGPHTSSPCCLPFNDTWGGVEATSTPWANGTRVLGYYWGGWVRPAPKVVPPPPTPASSSTAEPASSTSDTAGLSSSVAASAPGNAAKSNPTVLGKRPDRSPPGAKTNPESERMQVDPPAGTQSQALTTTTHSPTLVNGQSNGDVQTRRKNSVWVKHIFTCNLAHLQVFAGELVTRVQTEVELIRPVADSTSPFFECAYDIPSTPSPEAPGIEDGEEVADQGKVVPEILLQAAKKLAERTSMYSEESVKVEKLRVLGWMAAGSRKNQGVLKAKEHPVAIMCLGTDVVLCLSPVREAPKAKKSEIKKLSAAPKKVEPRMLPPILTMVVQPEASTSKAVPKGKGKVLKAAAQPEDGQPLAPAPKRKGRPPGSKNKLPRKDKGKRKGKERAVEPEKVVEVESEDEPELEMEQEEKAHEADEVDPQMDYDMSGLLRMEGIEEEVEKGGNGGALEEDGGSPMNGSSFMKANAMEDASPSSQPAEVETSVKKITEGTVQIAMVHGDMLVVYSADFTYSLKRSGIGFLIYGMKA